MIWLYGGFIVFILALLALDLGVLHKRDKADTVKAALGWSALWISIGVAFSGVIYLAYDQHWFGGVPHDLRGARPEEDPLEQRRRRRRPHDEHVAAVPVEAIHGPAPRRDRAMVEIALVAGWCRARFSHRDSGSGTLRRGASRPGTKIKLAHPGPFLI